MADLSHLDGAALENPDRISDSAKSNIVTGTTVKSLDTGHTEASLKDHMSKEMELLALGNGNFFMKLLDGLLSELIELIKKYLKDPLAILEDGFDLLIKVGGGALALGFGLGEALFGFLSDIGGTIVSLFTNEPRQLAPGFSELRANLEADVAPFMESFKKNGENAAEALGKVGVLREEVEQKIVIVEGDIRSAENALAAIGDVDKKIADQALIHIRDSEAALEEAKGAMEALAAYKDVIDPQIQSALADAQDGLGRLDTLEPQVEAATKDLSDYKAVIDPKIQDALADSQAGLDRLDTLEPKVSTVISDLDAYEKATNAKIQDLLGKASGAITDAGQALTQYDDLLSEYEVFKTQASGSLEALRKSSTTQGQKLGVIEDDMPGIKTSITNVFALAETAQETVDNLQIGGRNLLLDSAKERGGHRFHEILTWEDLGDYVGEQVTVSADFKGVGPGQISIYPYQSHGLTVTGTLYVALTEDWTRATWQGTVTDYGDTVENRTKGGIAVYATTSDTKIHSRRWKIERGNKATDWTPAPEDVAADIAKAQAKADQATLDAEEKATAAREAAELYAKEKSEADAAQALVDATAEAARVAKAEADAAKAAAATDATNKVDAAQTALKTYAETQAAAAKEGAEATAALDATTKANKAKVDAEKEAKRLSDIAAAAAATAQATANQAKADAESKANAAREAAEKYAKEKSEADAAQALVDATAEAARVAQEAAAQAVLDSASDADTKVALAEAALKAYAEAQAEAAQEAAEATAALDATNKANKAKTDAEANAKKLSDAAAASAAAAQSTADQAKLDATNKAAAAQTAAQNYAKEKAEAERALAEENAAAEALRVAQQEANAAKTAAATDAKAKADEAERLAKIHADAQAALAKEQAEATAALDATTKANKAKKDAEANAKVLSDKAQKLAEDVKFTADTTAGKIPGMQDSITTAHSKAEAAQSTVDNLRIGGRNLITGTSTEPETLVCPEGNYLWETGTNVQLEVGREYTFSVIVDKITEDEVPINVHLGTGTGRNYLRDMHAARINKIPFGERIVITFIPSAYDIERGEFFAWRIRNERVATTVAFRELKLEHGNKVTDWTPAPEDVAAEIAKAQAKADKAEQDAEEKANAAREAAELYAKEKSEADVALAEERAAAEAARVAKEAADAAKTAAATDATNKADEAERLAKLHADAQAAAAQEAAEATAALDATTKANKAKVDAEKEAKRLSDIAAAAAATAQATANQAKADAESKANAAREAAEKYAKEKSEADAAQALVDATAEAARVAQEAAAQAVLDSASDADTKVALAEAALKAYAEAQAEAAQEAAEATAALDATTKANKAKADAEKEAKRLSDIAAAAAATAQATANQAKADAESKAAAAQTAAQKYAKEKSEADVAASLVTSAAEALRVAKLQADAAKTAAATDAKAKADEAERLAKIHADAQAALAKEQAEATAALDATTKADKAKADAEANAKILSDKAQKLAEDVKFTADTTAGKIPGMQDAITIAHGKAEEAQRNLDDLQIGGRNLVRDSEFVVDRLGSAPDSRREYYAHAITGGYDNLKDGDTVTVSFDMEVVVGSIPVRVQAYNTNVRGPLRLKDTVRNYSHVPVGATLKTRVEMQTSVVDHPEENRNRDGNYIEFYTIYGTNNFFKITNLKIERGNKATDWTPAPEDVEAEIAASVQTSADALNTYRTANDKAVSDANDAAAAAAGVAKDKGEVIYQSTAPTGARATKANLWIRTSDNKPHTYNGSKWVEVTDKAATDAADKAATALSTAQKKTTTYYGSAAPTGTKTAGDLWLDSGSDNALKRWSGSAWVEVRDGQLAKALKAAGDAQSTADGKVRSFARSTAPTGMTATDVGDIWLDTDDGNKMYRWSGTSWVTMQDHLAVQAKEVADTATTKAETAQSTVDNLQIGGRNLLLNSQPYFSEADGYEVDAYNLSMAPEAGELVTITIYGSLPEGRTGWGIYNSGTGGNNNQGFARLISPGVYSLTYPWKSAGSNTYVRIYSAISSGQAAGSPGVVRLDRVKLERGNKATDWTPAPEDVDKSIADVDYKASETGKLIPGMQDSLNIAHSKAETAQSTVDNLQIGGRNLLLNSKTEETNTKYPTISPYFPEGQAPKDGEQVTLSMRLEVGENATHISLHNSGGSYGLGSWGTSRIDSDGLFRTTFTWKEYEGSANTYLNVYLVHSGDRKPVTIHWVKLERGNRATDWTPAPEDVDAGIQAQANALAGYQLSNDTAVDAAKKAAQDAAGLAGGKGEVIYSTTTPPTSKRSAANLWIKGPKNTPNVWNGSAWVEITDQAAKDAAKAAADANALAETKTTTYYQTSAPAASKSVVGDLWIDQSTAGKNALKRWSGSAWVAVQDKAIAEALNAAGTAQSTADEKVRTFARTTAPTGMKSEHVGDLWIDTDDGNKLYRWSGSAWVGVQDAAIAAAKEAAATATSKAETAQETVDNLQIGGRNLLLDSEKERGGGRFHGINTWRDLKNHVGQQVMVSAEFKGTGSGRISIYGYQNHGLTVLADVALPLTEEWVRHSWSGTVTDYGITNTGWTEGSIAVYGTTADTKIHSREWKIERGNRATDWTPAPEDTQAEIKGLINTADGLTTGLSNAATQEDYKRINNQLWGGQGELNKLNSLLWDDQGRLNKATEIFKSNIKGWQEDVYNAFVDFDGINKRQDGLIAANNRAVRANTQAVSAHQRILQVAYPDSGSAIPMVPGGVNVGTEDAPEYEAMPEWLNAYGVTKVTGTTGMDDKRAAHANTSKWVSVTDSTKVKVNPTALYRYSFWIMASATGSEAYIRLSDQNGNGAVLENTPDAGVPAPRASERHLFWFNGNVPTAWTKISGVIRLNPDVTHVYIDRVGLNYQGTTTNQWLADIQLEPIIPSQSEVNRALSEVNDAQTAILTGHQNVLDMAFPNTSLVPMVDGVPVWASTVAANPIRTTEGNWRFTSGTAVQPGTGGKHVPTVNGVVYRAIARVRRTSSGTSFSVRIRKAGGSTNVTRTAVTNKPALPGATRTDFIMATGVITAAVNVWETWYYDFTLANNTGDVRIGYALGSVGVEVAQFDVVALLPDQTEVNRINNEINTTQNDVLHDHQRALDLMYPADNIVPRDPAGLNVGTEAKPQYVEFPYWLKNGIYSVQPAGSLPAGNRLSARVTTTTTPNTIGPRASVTPGVDYNYEFYFKATAANSGLVIYLVDQNGTVGPGEWNVADGGYSTSSTHLWWNGNMPGGTGPETGGFHRMSGKIRFKPGVTGISIERIYYNWSTGAVTTTQELTGIRIWPDIPSQQQVDEAQNEAIEANKKAISLAFPDMNLDPQTSAGHPEWSTPSTVTVKTTGSLGARNPSYQINGTVSGGLMQFQPDIREYRIRGWITPGPGSNPYVYLYILNEGNTRIIEAWRPTFPEATTEAEELAGSDEVKWTTANNVLFSVDGGNAGFPGEWEELDVVVRLRAGDTVGKIQLASVASRWVTLSDFRVTAFAPSQWQVDYAQNKALSGLAHSISVQNEAQGELEKAIGPNGLGGQVEDLEKTIREVQSYIPRSMVMNLGASTPKFENDHFIVHNNNGDVKIEALGGDTGWTGHAIFTYVYGTSHETDIVEFKIPDTADGSRNKVRTTQSRTWRRMARLDYWVDNGEQVTKKIAKSPNTDMPSGWSTRSEMTFKALETGFHIANFKVEWPYTARNGTQYGVQIKRNGTVVNTLTEKNIGPTFPWENGRRTQSINWSGQLTKGQTLTFEVYATGSTKKWRTLGKEERRVSWVSK